MEFNNVEKAVGYLDPKKVEVVVYPKSVEGYCSAYIASIVSDKQVELLSFDSELTDEQVKSLKNKNVVVIEGNLKPESLLKIIENTEELLVISSGSKELVFEENRLSSDVRTECGVFYDYFDHRGLYRAELSFIDVIDSEILETGTSEIELMLDMVKTVEEFDYNDIKKLYEKVEKATDRIDTANLIKDVVSRVKLGILPYSQNMDGSLDFNIKTANMHFNLAFLDYGLEESVFSLKKVQDKLYEGIGCDALIVSQGDKTHIICEQSFKDIVGSSISHLYTHEIISVEYYPLDTAEMLDLVVKKIEELELVSKDAEEEPKKSPKPLLFIPKNNEGGSSSKPPTPPTAGETYQAFNGGESSVDDGQEQNHALNDNNPEEYAEEEANEGLCPWLTQAARNLLNAFGSYAGVNYGGQRRVIFNQPQSPTERSGYNYQSGNNDLDETNPLLAKFEKKTDAAASDSQTNQTTVRKRAGE